MSSDPRYEELQHWLQQLPTDLGLAPATLRPASADASFRRYFRLDSQAGSRIVMDAPPEHESLSSFINIGERLAQAGLNVPIVLAQDAARGFMLLSDLGTQTYYDALQAEPRPSDSTIHNWYMAALQALIQLQQANTTGLPVYDSARLIEELQLFPQWYVERHHGATLSDTEKQQLERIFVLLAQRAAAQPQVLVHRDYHSPNLMLPQGDDPRPGVIDYQDAVLGPITYDLVSVLMDARTTWDEEQQLDWGIRYWELARQSGLPVNPDIAEFHADWEWVGLQRNLRILGVFARLNLRDGKPQYLRHMERVEQYVIQVASHFDVFRPLLRLMDRLTTQNPRQAQ